METDPKRGEDIGPGKPRASPGAAVTTGRRKSGRPVLVRPRWNASTRIEAMARAPSMRGDDGFLGPALPQPRVTRGASRRSRARTPEAPFNKRVSPIKRPPWNESSRIGSNGLAAPQRVNNSAAILPTPSAARGLGVSQVCLKRKSQEQPTCATSNLPAKKRILLATSPTHTQAVQPQDIRMVSNTSVIVYPQAVQKAHELTSQNKPMGQKKGPTTPPLPSIGADQPAIQEINKPDNNDGSGPIQIVKGELITPRYKVVKKLGEGSYGVVVKCLDITTEKQVAIKVLKPFPGVNHNAMQEVEILRHLLACDADNTSHIIHIVDCFGFKGQLCVCFELGGHTLYKVLKLAGRGLQMQTVRSHALAILRCLTLLKREGITHGDLKPGNIVTMNGSIKVIDFGLSTFGVVRGPARIQTLWYKAPEVLLGLDSGPPMDMWSLGCTLAKLYSGRTLFPGIDEEQQLALIMQILNEPPSWMVWASPYRTEYFDETGRAELVCDSRGNPLFPDSIWLSNVLGSNDYYYIDFIAKCLKLDPRIRMSPEEAMAHPWIQCESN